MKDPLLHLSELIERSADIEPSIARELSRASVLYEHSFITEASLRLGRALEAGLYAAGRVIGVDLSNRSIIVLQKTLDKIREAQVHIISRKTKEEVKKLSKCVSDLVGSIVELMEDDTIRGGEINVNDTKNNSALFSELILNAGSSEMKSRLGRFKAGIQEVQNIRNSAAHAALDGSEREMSKEEFHDAIAKFSPIIDGLLALILYERFRPTLTTEDPAP